MINLMDLFSFRCLDLRVSYSLGYDSDNDDDDRTDYFIPCTCAWGIKIGGALEV